MSTAQRVTRGFHRLGLFLAAVPLMGTYAYAAPSENWICGIPTLVDPWHVNLFDFDVVGDELVQNGPSKDIKLQFPILKNDERAIVFKWLDTAKPTDKAPDIGVIDKTLGSFKVYREGRIADSGGVEGSISAEGSCQRFER